MILFVDNHTYHYETENLCRVFFPNEQIKVVFENETDGSGIYVRTSVAENGHGRDITVSVLLGEKSKTITQSVSADIMEYDSECERTMAVMLFDCLSELSGYTPDWGILTGVRPSKLMNKLTDTMGDGNATDYFRQKLLVSEKKTKLAYEVAQREKAVMSKSRPESFSLYVSIPFCPTRCSYCSFVSHSMAQAQKLLPDYVDLLCKEIKISGEIAKDLGLRLETVYYGGGTPSILSAEQTLKIGSAIENAFDLSTVSEYTVEAGRPDTITEEKLSAMKSLGVSRISINPQTFNDASLEAIGRKHNSECTLKAYALAQKCGFDNINMDLIAGLPLDTLGSFNLTLDKILELDPQGVTVHTLALKRSSTLVTSGLGADDTGITPAMLDTAYDRLKGAGYLPYYMYRQTRSLGNLENVGYCKPGKDGLYNIYMMEECHSVFAVGAGAVIKLKEPRGSYIERVFNFKYPYEYNSRFDEIIQRKAKIKDFYAKYTVSD